MSREGWVPLSQRRGRAARFEPITGMPTFLRETIAPLLVDSGRVDPNMAIALGLALHINTAGGLRLFRADFAITAALGDDEDLWLDALDFLLNARAINPKALRTRFEAAGHELTVAPDGKSLIERVEPSSVEAFEVATSAADAASAHLNQAWVLTFGRDPRPSDGWGYAIKAVETLLGPVTIPNDSKATLGKMNAALRAKPERFTCRLPDRTYRSGGEETVKLGLEVLTDMIATIGYQPDRHGSDQPSKTDPDVARSVVLLATTVVAWLRDNVLVRLES